jgi:hypothetical protein
LTHSTTQIGDNRGFEEIMVSFRTFFAAALLSTAVPGAAKEPAYYDSLRLVSAMRQDEWILRLVRAEKSRSTRLSPQDLQCLDSLEYPELTDIVARQIVYNMTAAEVQDALGYFHSSPGRKFVKRELEILREAQFTATDRIELEKFAQRSAGRKLLGETVLKNAAVLTEAAERVERRLEDCGYLRQNDMQREIPEKSCQARPVSSSDNVCLATYGAEGSAKKPRRASVEVNCRQDGRVLTSRINLPRPEAPIALRWSANRDLEILVDGKVKSAPASAGSGPKISFASWQESDPPLLTCATQMRGPPTLASSLPPIVTIGAWRAYSRPGLCLMTSRVREEEVSGAQGDVLLQFRRQNSAVAPFATTELALVVAINQQSESPLWVDFAAKRLSLISHSPQQTHLLAGADAEMLLEALRAKAVELSVKSDGAPGYSIPMRGLDFDVAYAEFGECLAALAVT